MKVVKCSECKYNNACKLQFFIEDESVIPFDRDSFFCADGEEDVDCGDELEDE